MPYAVTLDITGQVPDLSGTLLIAAWIFAPHDHQIEGVIFCPGSKAYYHLFVPGMPEDSYSFALYMAERGWLVIAIDALGTGESSHPDEILTEERLACASGVAYQHILARILDGNFDFRLPRFEYPAVSICVGHGKHALLAMIQQTQYHSFDALALSGWSNSQFSLGICESALARALGKEDGQATPEKFSALSVLKPFFFSADVPSLVIDSCEVHGIVIDFIQNLTKYDYNLAQRSAALLDVPIFLSLADNDVADNLRAESATYPWSPEVTTLHLSSSAHLHNFANTREVLWSQLEAWMQQVREQILQR